MKTRALVKNLLYVLLIQLAFEITFINILNLFNISSSLPTLVIDKVLFLGLLFFLNNKFTKKRIPFSIKLSINERKCVFLIFLILAILGLTNIQNFLDAFIIGLIACTTEEYLMRGIVLISLLRIFQNSKNNYLRILLPIAFSSILFGLDHFINLYSQNFIMTFAQVIATTATGFVLASIFLRTRNLLYPMLCHFGLDFLIVITKGMPQDTNVSLVSVLLPSAFYLFISFVILVPILIKK
ncbi:type II CAAX prenyl endopeptidase Rce1 family protein [Companilactobacillus halodurans]|uniref:CPBP family glutamic-type intramembrane protease n=1 Tax=Companilactobacillus halodurans TaxID=2584183 RepID=UPI00129821E1